MSEPQGARATMSDGKKRNYQFERKIQKWELQALRPALNLDTDKNYGKHASNKETETRLYLHELFLLKHMRIQAGAKHRVKVPVMTGELATMDYTLHLKYCGDYLEASKKIIRNMTDLEMKTWAEGNMKTLVAVHKKLKKMVEESPYTPN